MSCLETPIDGVEAAMDEAGTTITFTGATMDGSEAWMDGEIRFKVKSKKQKVKRIHFKLKSKKQKEYRYKN